MQIFGFSVGDWAGLIAIITAIVSMIMFLYKKTISEPNERSNHALSAQIQELAKAVSKLSDNTDGLKDKVNDQDKTLVDHEDRIENLENNHDRKKRHHE